MHTSRWGLFMSRLREMVENPQSGLPGKVFACLSILFVATTAVSLCVSTMPDLRAEEDKVSSPSLHQAWVPRTRGTGGPTKTFSCLFRQKARNEYDPVWTVFNFRTRQL